MIGISCPTRGGWKSGVGYPQALLGLHLNMVKVTAADVRPTTTEEEDWRARFAANAEREGGYSHEQGTRPQTLGVSMADSPVGAAAWILEKFGVCSDLPKRDDGSRDLWARFSEEQLLTNIMLYVAPAAVVTATWIYQGQREDGADKVPAGTRVTVPTGVAAFPDPVFVPPPRSYANKTYNIVHWTEMTKGGHSRRWKSRNCCSRMCAPSSRAFKDIVAKTDDFAAWPAAQLLRQRISGPEGRVTNAAPLV